MNYLTYENGDILIKGDTELNQISLTQNNQIITINKEQLIGFIIIFRDLIDKSKKNA